MLDTGADILSLIGVTSRNSNTLCFGLLNLDTTRAVCQQQSRISRSDQVFAQLQLPIFRSLTRRTKPRLCSYITLTFNPFTRSKGDDG
ncbi:MAG: hypothetical protein JWQ42_1566 [Edaphobacter sp.]|nr:hypothetical protein [Edaphobacter sp.]